MAALGNLEHLHESVLERGQVLELRTHGFENGGHWLLGVEGKEFLHGGEVMEAEFGGEGGGLFGDGEGHFKG